MTPLKPFACLLLVLCTLTGIARADQARDYHLDAGPLGTVLSRFAHQAGLTLSVDARLTTGKTSPGLEGRYPPREGLLALLSGTGLTARVTEGGVVTLVAVDEHALAPVTVASGVPSRAPVSENSGAYTMFESTLGKTPQSLRETPRSVSVLTRQRLDDQGVSSLPEAMKYVTGVTVERFDGGGYFNNFTARGYPADTFQLDGINVQTNANMTDTDLVVYDRVEILRGASGLFQGSGEPGVTVNLARKRALAEYRARGLLSAGRWDSYRGEADLTGPLTEDGRLRGRLVAAYDDRDSYMDRMDSEKQVAYGTLEYDLDEMTTLSLGLTWQEVDAITNQGLPLGANGQLLDLPRSTAIVADWTTLDMKTLDGFAELERRLRNGGEVKLAVRRVERDRTYRSIQSTSLADANGDFTTAYYVVPAELEDTSADLYLNTPFHFGGRTHDLVVGTDYRRSDNLNLYGQVVYSPAAGGGNVFDFVPPTEPAEVDGGRSPSVTEVEQFGVYARTRLRVTDRLSTLLGLRGTWWDSRTRDRGTGATTGEYDVDREVTPYGALLYELNDQWSAYTSYAEIFKPQNAVTRTGDQIEPRTGEQYEVGLKGEYMQGRLNVHAALFRIEDRNRALPDPADPTFSVALGRARSEGFETEISGYLTERWLLTAGYAYTSTEYVRAGDGQEGETFSPLTPRHNVNLWAKYGFSGGALTGLDLGGGVRAVSDFYAGSGNATVDAPGYATVSLFAGYPLGEHTRVALNVDNLLDKKYYEKVNAGTRQNYYGMPRNITLTLRARF
ncbi:TonB-dependent siderophore receptor [Alloalcanivorax sp. C16-1]|uniref:TonB-dependent siderophore receptor n=1 Tax=Alloalcanivorax sp. C16-1 TaxID=3390051 RepID=UPI003970939D